jgi:hypothetical protein
MNSLMTMKTASASNMVREIDAVLGIQTKMGPEH